MTVIRTWNLLANGSGGVDWAGLPYAVALFGVTDVEGLMHGLMTIKTHKPPQQGA